MLEHGVHAGGEREVEDVDAMMHALYYELHAHPPRQVPAGTYVAG